MNSLAQPGNKSHAGAATTARSGGKAREATRASAEILAFLDGVVGVVEANSYESMSLWLENSRREKPLTWVENCSGYGQTVGTFGGMPVFVSLLTAAVDGHKLLFVDATSQVVDHRMIERWLERNLPKTAFRENGYVNRTDAMNFHNVFPRVRVAASDLPDAPDSSTRQVEQSNGLPKIPSPHKPECM